MYKNIRNKFIALPGTIRTQMALMVSALVLLQILFGAAVFSSIVAEYLDKQIGARALRISQTVALMPTIINALKSEDRSGTVQEIAEKIRIETGAEYVVVADKNALRYSHPVTGRIGKKFVGGDVDEALKDGHAYISKAVGTLGPSVRGIVPVMSADEVIGFVAVGYLQGNVQRIISEHQRKPFLYVIIMLLMGLGGAVLIANYIKKITLNLEPQEIAGMYLQRGAIIESIREGIVAADRDGVVRLVNSAAKTYLGIDKDTQLTGKNADETVPELCLSEIMETGKEVQDNETAVNGTTMVVNAVPLIKDGRTVGAVASFRRKDELDKLTRELAKAMQCSEMLRVQSHEYSNKLHTIAGLLQIEAYDEAQDIVLRESRIYHELVEFLSANVPDSFLSAIIIGKHNKAQEMKINFAIEPNSRMADIPAGIDREKLVTRVGNLLDNALEAASVRGANASVLLSLCDKDGMLSFTVEDSGRGVDKTLANSIFNKGSTTKGENRGVGLYLVKKSADSLGGTITVNTSDLGGAAFEVKIPKNGHT